HVDLLLQALELMTVGAQQCFEETHAVWRHVFEPPCARGAYYESGSARENDLGHIGATERRNFTYPRARSAPHPARVEPAGPASSASYPAMRLRSSTRTTTGV